MASLLHRFRRRREIAVWAAAYAIAAHLLMLALAPLALAAQAPDTFGGVLCTIDGAMVAHGAPDQPAHHDTHAGQCLFCQARADVAMPAILGGIAIAVSVVTITATPGPRDARPGDGGGGRPQVPRGPPATL